MRGLRPHQRLGAWLALVATLALALLPAVSHALASGRGPLTWTEVCTPLGMKVLALQEVAGADGTVSTESAGAPTAPSAAAGHLEHCPFCSLSASAFAPPAADPVTPLLAGLSDAPPRLFLHGPRQQHAWVSAQPRAPPCFS